MLALRCLNKDKTSYGGFLNKTEPGEINEATDWSPEPICGNGIHFWPYGIGRSGKEHVGDMLWQVVEPIGEVVSLDGKAKARSVKVLYTGSQAECMKRLLPSQIKYVEGKSSGNGSSAATSGNRSSAATSGNRSSAATSGEGSSAATSGKWSSAATSGNESSAATSGNESSAASSGDVSSAATSGDVSSAVTSGNGSSAATSGDESSAVTSGYRSSAATSGYGSSAATSGYGSSAASSGYRSSAATSGDWSSAASSGYRSSAATSGDWSSATSSGYRSASVVSGDNGKAECGDEGVAVCLGINGKVIGGKNSTLILYYLVEDVLVPVIGFTNKELKPNTLYELKDGTFSEV